MSRMSLRTQRRLMTSILAGMLVTAPAAIAYAQPEDEEVTDEEVDLDEEVDEEEAIPPPADDGGGIADDDGQAWGVGGEEPEGKYKPAGKTGKLAELEDDEEEEEEIAEGPADLPPPGWVNLDTYVGVGDVLVVRYEGAAEVTPTAAFIIGTGYRIADMWEVYARFAVMSNQSNGPRPPFVEGARDPDEYKQISTGGLEIGTRPWFAINRDLVIPVGLSFTLPTGQGDMFAGPDERANLGKRIVNLAAAAASGYRERAIFASRRFGITPSGGVRYQIPDLGPGKLQLHADTKVDIMVKTGGTEPTPADELPPDTRPGELKTVSVNWVIGGGAAYAMFDEMLKPGLDLWLAVGTADETVGNLDPGGAQFIFEPNIGTHIDFTSDESFGMDGRFGAILPAGGELGGGGPSNSTIYGFRITAGFFY